LEKIVAEAKKKRKKNPQRLIIPVYLVILVILIVCVYAFPSLTGAFSKTMVIRYGTLQNTHDVTCYIVRDETVYYAIQDGSVGYNYDEGTGVRAGTEIITTDASGESASAGTYSEYNKHANYTADMSAVISDKNRMDAVEATLKEEASSTDDTDKAEKLNRYIDVLDEFNDSSDDANRSDSSVPDSSFGVLGSNTTKSSGTLSYMMDGYETAFSPYTMSLLDKKKLAELDYDVYNFGTGKTLKDEPVFKIINSNKWYAVTWINASLLGYFSEGSSVELNLPKGSVKGTVKELYDEGNEIMMILEFNVYYEDLASLRKIDTTLMTSNSDGLVVDSSFIATENGVPGVYVLDVTGNTTFTPVKIIDSDGENMLVASGYYYEQVDGETKQVATVNVYDEIKKVEQTTSDDSKEEEE
jgi:putative membrane fusion protein